MFVKLKCHVVVWCCCQAALGLGVDSFPVVNSTAGSRLWKWSGRAHADDSGPSLPVDDAERQMSHQHDGNDTSVIT